MELTATFTGNVRILCREELASGFRLTGLPVVTADASTVEERVLKLANTSGVGVLLIDDELHRLLPLALIHRLDRRATPIIAPFPSPNWDRRRLAEEYVLEILRQAIGYRVRPR